MIEIQKNKEGTHNYFRLPTFRNESSFIFFACEVIKITIVINSNLNQFKDDEELSRLKHISLLFGLFISSLQKV